MNPAFLFRNFVSSVTDFFFCFLTEFINFVFCFDQNFFFPVFGFFVSFFKLILRLLHHAFRFCDFVSGRLHFCMCCLLCGTEGCFIFFPAVFDTFFKAFFFGGIHFSGIDFPDQDNSRNQDNNYSNQKTCHLHYLP